MSSDVRRSPGPSATGAEAPGGPAESASNSDALEAAVGRLTDVVDGLQRLVEVRVARARVELRERAFRGAGWVMLAALILTLVVRATIQIMAGLSGLLNQLFPAIPWVGDLMTGLAGLVLAAAVGLVVRARVRRKNLKRMRRRFESSRRPTTEAP